MPVAKPFQQDVFRPVLLSAPGVVSDERKKLIRGVLEICSSDIQFARKAEDAITFILTAPASVLPVLTSLVPASVLLGAPSFTLQVNGMGFTPTSVIMWNGSPEPTTYVSPTKLTTQVNMATAQFPVPIGVEVQNENGLLSNTMTFTFLP